MVQSERRNGCTVARKSGLYLTPLTADAVRKQLKQQFSFGQVTIKRASNGDWVILRDRNWGKKVKALWVKVCQENSSPQERLRLFMQYVREAAEKLERSTEKQVRQAQRFLKRVLTSKLSSRSVRRHNAVSPRSRQPRKHGKTRAPTAKDSDGEGDGDGSDNGSIKVVQRTQGKTRTQKGLDEAYTVQPFRFTIHTAQVGFAKLKAERQRLAADLRAFISPHKTTQKEVHNKHALCEL